MINIIKDGYHKESKQIIIDFINEYNGVEYTIQKTKEFCSAAKSKIKDFKSSETKQTLIDFTDFISERVN